jgi:hypothetical protein
VIAELFLEGTSMFTLSQLFKYRSGDYNPETSLEKIEDQHIRVGAVCVCVCVCVWNKANICVNFFLFRVL